MRFGLSENIIEQTQKVFEQFPNIEKVILYGSRAMGNYTEGSDIDLSVVGEGITNNQINIISIKLDELLLPYTFDISIFSQINNPNLIEHINRVGVSFYIKE